MKKSISENSKRGKSSAEKPSSGSCNSLIRASSGQEDDQTLEAPSQNDTALVSSVLVVVSVRQMSRRDTSCEKQSDKVHA